MIGRTIGRYVIQAPLGQGAMGVVYRASDTTLRREVALKIVSTTDPTLRARFLRECRAAAALMHTNIVAVFDVGEHEGLLYLAMELVEGTTLRSLIGDASVTIPMRIRWLLQIARAIDVAHQRNLVHRDVKPENVLITKDGNAKLTDFGIVKENREIGPQSFRTKTGDVLGTPDYMAPEQWASANVDGRADQYSWGLIAWELLSGRVLPLGRPPEVQTVQPLTPAIVAQTITRAIEYQRDARFPSMTPIIKALEPFAAEHATEGATTQNFQEAVPATIREAPPSELAEASRPSDLELAPTAMLPPIVYPSNPPPQQHVPQVVVIPSNPPGPMYPADVETTRRGRAVRPAKPSKRPFYIALVVTIAIALTLSAITMWILSRHR